MNRGIGALLVIVNLVLVGTVFRALVGVPEQLGAVSRRAVELSRNLPGIGERIPGGAPRDLRLEGQLQASTVEVSFMTGGRISRLYVREGQEVKQGDVVAELDIAELSDRERTAQTQLQSASSQLPQLQTSIEMQRQSQVVEIKRAEAGVAAARAQLDEVRSGARPQEVEQARQMYAAAQTRTQNAERELKRSQDLYASGSLPQKAVEGAQTQFDLAKSEERRAQEQLGLLKEGARPEAIAAAEARVREAEAMLEQTTVSDLAVKKLEQQKTTLAAEVETARTATRVAKTQRGYAKLVSPITGWVVSEDAHVGEVVGIGTKVVTVANRDELYFETQVEERQSGRFKQNDTVKVAAEAFPDREFEGTISAIRFQNRKDQLSGMVRLQIQVADETGSLRPGMRVAIVVPAGS